MSVTKSSRVVHFDYLKAFITALVVTHHSAGAYTTFAGYYPPNYILSSAPVIDPARWVWMDRLIFFNDKFFMFLMFFIAGLFTISSIKRKGSVLFFKDRLLRLGLPFFMTALFLSPICYFPTYRAVGGTQTYLDFWFYDFLPGHWLPGPPWFIWVLFAFTLFWLTALPLFEKSLTRVGRILAKAEKYPARAALGIFGLSCIAYGSLYFVVPGNGPDTWGSPWGPFWFQLNRLGIYFLSFSLGLALGTRTPTRQGPFHPESSLVRLWPCWLALGLSAQILINLISELKPEWESVGSAAHPNWPHLITAVPLFVICCTFTSLACLGFFSSWLRKDRKWLNWISANAYGVYLIHYPIVIALQAALLHLDWAAPTKFFGVTLGSLIVCWSLTSLLRKIPGAARLI